MQTEIIPVQKEGSQSDNEHTVVCRSREEAVNLFTAARKRLLDVNKWESYCNGLISADFTLCDAKGNPVKRLAQEDDYFKIDIPGPGPVEGDGYDWVQIENVVAARQPHADMELISIRVRPAPSPQNTSSSVAHFFSDMATSTFLIQRNGEKVTAAIHGRNEKANTDTSLADKVRNNMVAGAAIARFSDIQWKQLAIGLIS
jgi:hypothetical protein